MAHDDHEGRDDGGVGAAETLRSASQSTTKAAGGNDDEKMSLFWRVFGGTILSIVALVGITIYNNISSSISELRNEVSREREARAELVKKDEYNTRNQSQYERIRAAEGLKADLEGLKERTNTNAAAIDALKRDTATAVDTVKKDTAGLDLLKEKLTTAAGELKAVSDAVQKVQQELEKNRASDLERKAFRDAQAKQVEDALKDLQKGLQDCREKLARLEGAQPPLVGPPVPKAAGVPAKVPPAELKDESGSDAGTGKPGPGGVKPVGEGKTGPGG